MHSLSRAWLYEQVARIGKAISSPKRLELIDLLAQGEKTVETLAKEARIDMRLASAHLKALREARLVQTRRDGKFIRYRLSGPEVAQLSRTLREVAEERLVELRLALDEMASCAEDLDAESRESLLAKARNGDVLVLDVRPAAEYEAGHLPFARSMPLAELRRRLAELPPGKEIVAYCRGPFCLMSDEAVRLLRRRGFAARRISEGVTEWQASGQLLEH